MRLQPPATAFFTRHLREDARSWLIALVRAGVLVLGLVSLWFFLWETRHRPEPAPGRSLLLVFSMVALTSVHLFGVAHFASVITEEKEDQTLGLLVTTGLHPLAILVGKAGSRLLSAGLVLLISLPLSLLCHALGGVSGQQIVATYVVLGAMLLCLSAAGLLLSVVCARTRVAVALVMLLLVVLHLGGPLLHFIRWICVENAWFARDSLRMAALDGLADAWLEANPYRRLFLVLGTFYDDGWIPSGLLPMCVPALVFYALSIPAFVRLTGTLREQEGGGHRRRAGSVCATERTPVDWPIFWKDNRWRTARPWMAWAYPAFLCAAFVLLLWIQLRLADAQPADWYNREKALFATGFASAYAAAILFVLRGGGFWSTTFAQEIRGETFAALVALPGGLNQAVREKCAAVMRALVPDAVVFLLGILLCWKEIRSEFSSAYWGGDDWFVLFSLLFGGVSAILLFWSLCLRLSLALKRGAPMVALALMGAGAFLLALFMDGFRIHGDEEIGWTIFLTGVICLFLARRRFLSSVHRLGEAAGD